jgi:type II secretory pathway pseudopilin PulG
MYLPHHRSGFTLIDTLMAASIMALVLIGVFSLLKSGVADTRSLEQTRQLDQVALSVRSCILSQTEHTIGMSYGISYSATNWCTRTTGAATPIEIIRNNGSETRAQQYSASYTVAAGTSPNEQIITQTVD